MSTAIVLCSRSHSSRVPGKCFIPYCGVTHIEHLVTRLAKTDFPIYLAIPEKEKDLYMFLLAKYPKRVFLTCGHDDDPLARIEACARQNNIDTVIRVTHDKIFVATELMQSYVEHFKNKKLDYLFASDFIPGTGFEVISYNAIVEATRKFKKVEHISYAIKAITTNYENRAASDDDYTGIRLLVDYPEDVQLMDILFSTLGPNCEFIDVFNLMNENPWLKYVNKLPQVTIYTCAYNAEKWITECMGSVAMQENFKNYEYLIIDDASTDKTLFHVGKFCQTYKNAKFYKNVNNCGLASSSNRALKLARGEYIIRLDADDYFSDTRSISKLLEAIKDQKTDVIYPDCYLGVGKKGLQKGNENHHAGGALFKTSAINHVKFTDRLRGYDSLDVFLRAKDKIKIGYLNSPTFVYRQHPNSMSKTNVEAREKIRSQLLEQHGQPS